MIAMIGMSSEGYEFKSHKQLEFKRIVSPLCKYT